ncbi:hypothetical protein TM239_38690 [Bradyrhizobium sp. TM239]|nr:hypothetical protein TM239_38690 [Bradyrhizobium sp. TM239]
MFSVRERVPRREQVRDAGVLGVDLLSTPGRGLVFGRKRDCERFLLVALRERIRLDEIGGLVDQLELAI